MGCLIQGSLVYVFVAFSSSQMSWVVDIYGVTSFIPVFYTLLVTTGVIRYGFVLRVTQGHWYMWRTPLLAPVSTVGKTRLLVVAVQGAPRGPVFPLSVSVCVLVRQLRPTSRSFAPTV